MEQCVDEASIIIRNTKEPTLTLKVILTSPLIRDELEKKDGGTHVYIYVYVYVYIERHRCVYINIHLFCSHKTSLKCCTNYVQWI